MLTNKIIFQKQHPKNVKYKVQTTVCELKYGWVFQIMKLERKSIYMFNTGNTQNNTDQKKKK